MSYILEALKKAEHQRDIGRVPGIGSEHEPVVNAGTGRWLWVLIIALVVNVALLTVALWPRHPVTQQHTAAVAAPAGSPVAPAAQPTARVVPPRTPVPEPAPAVKQAAPPPPVAVVAPPPTPAPALRPLPPLQQPVTSTPAVVHKQVKVTPPGPEPVAADANLPVWPQIPPELFGEINNSLHLDVHVYSEVPQERFVLINMRKYTEGQRLQEGPVVDAIRPDGVILSFRGQRFRITAQ